MKYPPKADQDRIKAKLLKYGLAEILEAAYETIGPARIMAGHNDIALIVFVKPEEGGARMHACARERALEMLTECVPEATNTIAQLSEKPPPDRFPLVISIPEPSELYYMSLSLEGDTRGVLN